MDLSVFVNEFTNLIPGKPIETWLILYVNIFYIHRTPELFRLREAFEGNRVLLLAQSRSHFKCRLIAQDLSYLRFEYLQGWQFHSLYGQHVAALKYTHTTVMKNFLLLPSHNFLCCNFCQLPLIPVLLRKKMSSSCLWSPNKELKKKIMSPFSSLFSRLKTEFSAFPHMLQSFHNVDGSLLDLVQFCQSYFLYIEVLHSIPQSTPQVDYQVLSRRDWGHNLTFSMLLLMQASIIWSYLHFIIIWLHWPTPSSSMDVSCQALWTFKNTLIAYGPGLAFLFD